MARGNLAKLVFWERIRRKFKSQNPNPSSFGLTKTLLFMSDWTVFKCFEKFAAQKWKRCLS